jgi:ABC-type Zn uptake system ZnuABC Zn-binding protein ZnuA
VGKDYIKKLTALDNEIEKAFNQISEDKASVLKAQGVFDNYIKGLEVY